MFAVRVSDSPKPPALDEDADVAGERARICTNQKTNEILRIQDLSKVKRFYFRNVTDNGNQVKKKKTHQNGLFRLKCFCLADVQRNVDSCCEPHLRWSFSWRGLSG